MVKVKILSDNIANSTEYAEWGFSAYIEVNNKGYLYDTGQSGKCVIENADHLGIDLKSIEAIILSHGHFDHTNGLEAVLKVTGPKKIYAHPDVFDRKFSVKKGNPEFIGCKYTKDYLETLGATFEFHDKFQQIGPSIYMSGTVPITNNIESIPNYFKIKKEDTFIEDDLPDDNALIIEHEKGLIIVTGCAHRGVVNISTYIKEKMQKQIVGIIGGMHLHRANSTHFNFVVNFFKENAIPLIGPIHCTGLERIFELKKILPKPVKLSGCGGIFEF